MQTLLLDAPAFVGAAIFGIGLSYGLTSDLKRTEEFYRSPKSAQLLEVSKKLAHLQGGHNKFLETITLALDITAPRYWWQEFDTYRVGITKQSESTIHTLTSHTLTFKDFEGTMPEATIDDLNRLILKFKETPDDDPARELIYFKIKDRLPEGFLQRRIVTTNVKTLQNIYNQRKNHRLPQWGYFFRDLSAELTGWPHDTLIRYYIFKDGIKE